MPEYAGSAAYLGWVSAAGTITLHADFRTFTWAPTMNFIDATAGRDTYETLIASHGVGQEFSCEMLAQSGTAGTALIGALDRATVGTVLYYPAGTATNEVKYSIPAISTGPQWNSPFNDVTVVTANWRQSAAEART